MAVARQSARTLRNDARILDAAEQLAAVDGWTALLFHHVAAEAGMSVRPVRDRYDDRAALACDLWSRRLAAGFRDAVAPVIEAADEPTPDGLALAATPFLRPTKGILAISELLVVASFVPTLRETISGTFAQERWLDADVGRVTAARRAYAMSLLLGSLMMSRNLAFEVPDLRPKLTQVAEALLAEAAPAELPAVNAEHLDRRPRFNTGDPAWEALLEAALETVGEVGFDSATVQQIARRSGHTEGLIFSHYRTKRELFTDAALRSAASGFPENEAFQDRLRAQHSLGIAEATIIREFMKPGRERIRATYLEQQRLAWHDPELSDRARIVTDEFLDTFDWNPDDIDADPFCDQAIGLGVLLLSVIQPDSWSLPFDVVTVPLHDSVRPRRRSG